VAFCRNAWQRTSEHCEAQILKFSSFNHRNLFLCGSPIYVFLSNCRVACRAVDRRSKSRNRPTPSDNETPRLACSTLSAIPLALFSIINKAMGKKKSAKATVEAVPVDPSAAENKAGAGGGGDEDSTCGDAAPGAVSAYEELELLQVDLGDVVKMKQVLDEAVAAAVLEQVEEDYHWDNLKLGIMALACAFAMAAQFAPIPFPESRVVLGMCGCMYFVLSGVLQFITTFIDKDAILLTKADPESPNPHLKKYGIRVRSNLPRFSEWYSVILEFSIPSDQNVKDPPRVEQAWSVGQFFDKEGYFDEVGLSDEIDKLFERLESKQYDKPLDVKKTQ
jgi:signal peptidase complex subunit 2